MAPMKPLGRGWYWADQKRFQFPGLYFGNKRLIAIPRASAAPMLIEFPEQTDVIAKDQPQYIPMPVFRHGDEQGGVTCCWKLSMRDRIKLLFTGKLWHSIWTFYSPMQPQQISVDKPRMLPPYTGKNHD